MSTTNLITHVETMSKKCASHAAVDGVLKESIPNYVNVNGESHKMHTFFSPDPDGLADMVSIMINKDTYNPSVKDIMDKYYEMFSGKNRGNKADFFNSPEDVENSDTDG